MGLVGTFSTLLRLGIIDNYRTVLSRPSIRLFASHIQVKCPLFQSRMIASGRVVHLGSDFNLLGL
jgi:hypothetical protein